MSDAVCPVNRLTHDWNNGLACRWCAATRTPEDAIVSGLASRRGGTEDSARALLNAHRAEVLADDGQAYPGELAMLRGLVRALRPAAREGDLTAVQQEKATAPAATATPGFFQVGHTYQSSSITLESAVRLFRCTNITTHTNGALTAHGTGYWAGPDLRPVAGSATSLVYGQDDWHGGWSDVTEATTPDFFVPGHTYTRQHHGQHIEFHVTAVSTSPDGHRTVAHGWRTDPYTGWEPTDSDDPTGWDDVTEGGGQ